MCDKHQGETVSRSSPKKAKRLGEVASSEELRSSEDARSEGVGDGSNLACCLSWTEQTRTSPPRATKEWMERRGPHGYGRAVGSLVLAGGFRLCVGEGGKISSPSTRSSVAGEGDTNASLQVIGICSPGRCRAGWKESRLRGGCNGPLLPLLRRWGRRCKGQRRVRWVRHAKTS